MNTKLICRTRIGDKWFVLTDTYKLLTDDQMASREFSGEKVMEIPFNTVSRSFRFAFDLITPDKPEPDSGIDIVDWRNAKNAESDKYNAAFNFFAKHMQIEVVGIKNPYLIGEPMFIMDFLNHRSINNVLKARKKNEVFNRVNGMSLQQKLDLALNYMPSLYGKRHSEIMDQLVDFDKGLLMQEAYIDDFLEKYNPNNLSVSMNTYVNKAIQIGLITKSNNQYFIHGNEFVGTDVASIVGHFSKDPDTYNNFVIPKVNDAMKLPEDDLKIVIPDIGQRIAAVREEQKNKKQADGVNQAAYEQLKAEAKALGIKNVDQKSYKKLADEVEAIKRGMAK